MSGLHLHYSSAIFFLYLFLSLFVYLRTPQFDAAHKVTKIISIRRENDVPASTEIEHKNLIAKLFRSRLKPHCVYTLFHWTPPWDWSEHGPTDCEQPILLSPELLQGDDDNIDIHTIPGRRWRRGGAHYEYQGLAMVVVKLEAHRGCDFVRIPIHPSGPSNPTVLACFVKSNVFTMHIKNLTDEVVGRVQQKKVNLDNTLHKMYIVIGSWDCVFASTKFA